MEITNTPNELSHLLFLVLFLETIITFLSVRYECERRRFTKQTFGIIFSEWTALLAFSVLYIPFPYKLPFTISPLIFQGASCMIGGIAIISALFVVHIRKNRKRYYNKKYTSTYGF